MTIIAQLRKADWLTNRSFEAMVERYPKHPWLTGMAKVTTLCDKYWKTL